MLAAMAVTSCTKEVTSDVPSGKEVDCSVTIALSEDVTSTRAVDESDLPISNPMLVYAKSQAGRVRLFFMVSYAGKVVYSEVMDEENCWDGTDITFDFSLVSGLDYTVSAWADFCHYDNTYGYEEETEFMVYDVTYGIGEAPMVEIINDGEKVIISGSNTSGTNGQRDGYFGIKEVNFADDGEENSVSMSLTRPFALVAVSTTDLESPALANAFSVASYSGGSDEIKVPTTLDLLTGKVGDLMTRKTYYGPSTDEWLSIEYVLADEGTAILDYDDNSQFSYVYKLKDTDENVVSVEYTFNNIPVQRNYITKITGNILTEKGDVTVTLDQDWAGVIDYDAETETYTIDE